MVAKYDRPLLFPTGVVGSMPRPRRVRDLLARRGAMAPDEYARRMDDAVREVVLLQETVGLDIVSDGEWRRLSYVGVIADLAHGFRVEQNPADGRPFTVVVDRLSPKAPGTVAREVAFVKGLTDRQVKASLPSPALVAERMWDSERSSKAYASRREFALACVDILRREVELLRDEGVDVIQIDDPHLCLFVDPEVRRSYDDPAAAVDFAVEVVNGLVDGVKGVKTAVHLCRRAGGRAGGEVHHRGGYEPIIDSLNRLKVDQLVMEFAAVGAGDLAALGLLREDMEIGFGCVDVQPGVVDSVDTIVERVEAALSYVEPGRITLNPDCGFAPGAAAAASLEEAEEKLRRQTEAARRLREKYSTTPSAPQCTG